MKNKIDLMKIILEQEVKELLNEKDYVVANVI